MVDVLIVPSLFSFDRRRMAYQRQSPSREMGSLESPRKIQVLEALSSSSYCEWDENDCDQFLEKSKNLQWDQMAYSDMAELSAPTQQSPCFALLANN